MQDNNQEFLNLYSELENHLKNFYNMYSSKSIIVYHIDHLKKSYLAFDKNRANIIDKIRTLRNFLIHEADIIGGDSFTINQELIDFLKKEIVRIENPRVAYDVCTKKREMVYAEISDSLKSIVNLMIQNGYSHIPVLDKMGVLIGVFSSNVLLSYVYSNNNVILDDKATIADFLNYLNISSHFTECYQFVKKNTRFEKLVEIFNQRKINNKRLVMLLVTNNGYEDEEILGIITLYDVIK